MMAELDNEKISQESWVVRLKTKIVFFVSSVVDVVIKIGPIRSVGRWIAAAIGIDKRLKSWYLFYLQRRELKRKASSIVLARRGRIIYMTIMDDRVNSKK